MQKATIFREYFVNKRRPYFFGFALLSISCLLQLLIPEYMGQFTDKLKGHELTYHQAVRYALLVTAAGFGVAFFI